VFQNEHPQHDLSGRAVPTPASTLRPPSSEPAENLVDELVVVEQLIDSTKSWIE
jgi:hypothetical protein